MNNRRFSKLLYTATFVLLFLGLFFFFNYQQTHGETAYSGEFKIGCNNDSKSKCFDFGTTTNDPSITLADTAGTIKPVSNLFNDPETDGSVTYQDLKNNATGDVVSGFQIYFPATGPQSSSHFPLEDFVLEIRYKDIYSDNSSKLANNKRVFIYSRVNMTPPGGSLVTSLEVGKLLGSNDGQWKCEQVYFPRDEWQRIREINGKFNFKFVDARNELVDLPIDYISLKAISSDEAKWYTESRAIQLNLDRADYKETNFEIYKDPFKWFSVPTMKPIYPNQLPLDSELEKPVSVVSALSETEPFNLGIYAVLPVQDLSFGLNDLKRNGSNDLIRASNISIKKVKYNDKLWARKIGGVVDPNATTLNYKRGTYGLMPDYVVPFETTNIPTKSSQQFWGEVKLADNLAGGEYSGNIDIMIGGVKKGSIPITVNVIPLRLSKPTYVRSLYLDPQTNPSFYKSYGNIAGVISDMQAHGITNVITNMNITIGSGCGELDYKAFEENINSLKRQNLIDDVAVLRVAPLFGNIISSCATAEEKKSFWSKYRNKVVEEKLEEAFEHVKAFAEEQDIEAIVHGTDEPGNHADRNALVMVTHSIAKKVGLRTWVPYNDQASREKECPDCNPCIDFCYEKNGKKYLPPLTEYVDFKNWYLGSIVRGNGGSDINKDFLNTFGYYTTDYLQIRNPIVNRFLNSYYAEKGERTGAKMITNWAYIGEPGGDPYNEFDQNPRYRSDVQKQDFLLSYPTWSGVPNPTFAMIGLYEGIKDAKYIATLRELIIANPGSQMANDANDFLNSILTESRIKPFWVRNYMYNTGTTGIHNYIVKYLSGKSDGNYYQIFDENRSTMANFIKGLSKPHITLKANKTKVSSGQEILYTAEIKNSDVSKITNNKISIAIPSSTTYKEGSATSGGKLVGDKLEWNISEINGNDAKKVHFKVTAN